MSAVVRRHLLVSGLVQGVFFREATRRVASEAQLAGWVRNLTDGRVEVVLEGSLAAVGRVTEWCGQGPSAARVDSVEVVPEQPEGLSGFSIR